MTVSETYTPNWFRPLLSKWLNNINLLQQTNPEIVPRVLECLWKSQLDSKLWLIKTLNALEYQKGLGYIDIDAGWFGLLADMLQEDAGRQVFTHDIDPVTTEFGYKIVKNDYVYWKTIDMADRVFRIAKQSEEHRMGASILTINTSTEHVAQDHYEKWATHLPKHSRYVIQGNNFFDNPEHVRCHSTLVEFLQANTAQFSSVEYAGSLDCGTFTRFMAIGRV